MGRRRILIKPITDDRTRQVKCEGISLTFSLNTHVDDFFKAKIWHNEEGI